MASRSDRRDRRRSTVTGGIGATSLRAGAFVFLTSATGFEAMRSWRTARLRIDCGVMSVSRTVGVPTPLRRRSFASCPTTIGVIWRSR